MSESIVPSNRDLWDSVNQSRLELAELKGMIKMHFEDSKHHYPPCKPAADLQKTMLSSLSITIRRANLRRICRKRCFHRWRRR